MPIGDPTLMVSPPAKPRVASSAAVVTHSVPGPGVQEAAHPRPGPAVVGEEWDADTLALLADLGSAFVGISRRAVLGTVAYTVASQAVPAASWWDRTARRSARRRAPEGRRLVGRSDLGAMLDAVQFFSQLDQRHGGGHARSAVVLYLTSDVTPLLSGRFTDNSVRRRTFTAASELAYLAGWMAFDNGEHARAQQFFTASVKLAAEANDHAMAAHTLRAMAHQALDLGHTDHGLALAASSVEDRRYGEACPRERALLGVVHARAMAMGGQTRGAARALLRAEDDLAAADPGDDEPSRVFFFSEASLAHETGRTLHVSADMSGAERELRRSVRLRKASIFKRTHAVTLGYLGAVQADQGNIEEACATWAAALDAMEGVQSARARQTAVTMLSTLDHLSERGSRAAGMLSLRAKHYLATAG